MQLKHVVKSTFPLFHAANYFNTHIIVAGGGGPQKSGVDNGFVLYDEFGEAVITHNFDKELVQFLSLYQTDVLIVTTARVELFQVDLIQKKVVSKLQHLFDSKNQECCNAVLNGDMLFINFGSSVLILKIQEEMFVIDKALLFQNKQILQLHSYADRLMLKFKLGFQSLKLSDYSLIEENNEDDCKYFIFRDSQQINHLTQVKYNEKQTVIAFDVGSKQDLVTINDTISRVVGDFQLAVAVNNNGKLFLIKNGKVKFKISSAFDMFITNLVFFKDQVVLVAIDGFQHLRIHWSIGQIGFSHLLAIILILVVAAYLK